MNGYLCWNLRIAQYERGSAQTGVMSVFSVGGVVAARLIHPWDEPMGVLIGGWAL